MDRCVRNGASPSEPYALYWCAYDPCWIGYTSDSCYYCIPCIGLPDEQGLTDRAVYTFVQCVRSKLDGIHQTGQTVHDKGYEGAILQYLIAEYEMMRQAS